MKLKEDVILQGLRPEMLIAVIVCNDVYAKYGEELVITSAVDSKHSAKSLHYSGCAIDIRTRFFEFDEVSLVAADIRGRLTEDFDVVVESDHIHIEYQPIYK